MEVWKPIKDFPFYEVSSYGRIKYLARTYLRKHPYTKHLQKINKKETILKGWIKYRRNKVVCINVALRKNNKTHEFRIHRLVLNAFKGKCPKGKEGCHNDGNPLNNHIENLRWDTHTSNMHDCFIHGKKINPPIHYGENHPKAKFTNEQIKEIRNTIFLRGTIKELAKKYNVCPITISRIKDNVAWNHIKI